MGLVFTPSSLPESVHSMGDLLALAGTITFSGSYATGGDTFTSGQTPEDLLARIGLGRILNVDITRGITAEWDATAKKMKFYSAAYTEVSAAAYNAALTASPVPVFITGR